MANKPTKKFELSIYKEMIDKGWRVIDGKWATPEEVKKANKYDNQTSG